MADIHLNVVGTPYPWQRKVLRAWRTILFMVVLCARQVGKTTLLLAIILEAAAKKEMGLYWYVSPTLGLAKEQFQKFRNLLPPGSGFKFNESNRVITLPNGCRLMFVSYEQGDALRGHSVDGLVVDEVGSMDGSFVRDVLEPTTTQTGGWIIYCGTPPDPLESPDPTFFEGLCKYAQTGQDPEWGYFCFDHTAVSDLPGKDYPKAPTYRQRVERYKRIHGEDSISFEREYLCKFVRPDQISLDFENIRWFDNMALIPKPLETIITVDPSFADNEAADPRAIVTSGLSVDGDLWIMRAEQGRWDYNEFIARIYRAYEEAQTQGWNPQWIGIEKAGVGLPFMKALEREGEKLGNTLPVQPIPNFGSTLSRIMSLGPWLKDERIVLYEKSEGCKEIAEQAEVFPRGLLVSSGRTKSKSGLSHHYDVINALSFRTMTFYPPPRPRVEKVRTLEPGQYDFSEELAKCRKMPDRHAVMHVG
jgi:hypothetical protein